MPVDGVRGLSALYLNSALTSPQRQWLHRRKAPRPESQCLASLREQIDASTASCSALLNRRAGARAGRSARSRSARARWSFRPEREAQVIDGLKAAQPGPAAEPRASRRSGARSCRPAARWRRRRAWPTSARRARSAKRPRSASSARRSCECRARASTRCFRATSAGAADFGVVPVENSTEGVVARSLDLFLTTPLFIIGETSLFVRHNLLRQGELARRHRGRLRASAGAGAVPRLAQRPSAPRRAAAGREQRRGRAPGAPRSDARRRSPSERAASEFGLHVVAPAIQDDAHNRTRFAIVAHPDRHPQPQASGHDCTSLVVSVTNRPGAVHDMLVPLKQHGVSMTRFESRPARSGQWEYYFYIDLAGPPRPAARGAALQRTARACARSSRCSAPTPSTCTDPPDPHVQPTRRDRMRPDGRLVRARAQARRAGQARGRLQQVALDDRDRRRSSASIDQAAESALLAVSGSDIVLIAVPVAATEATFKAIRHLVEPGVLFMDVGSTKRDVVDAARRVLKERVRQLRARAPDRRQGGGRHRARRRHALQRPPGHPDAAAADRRRSCVQKATDVWSAIGAQVLRDDAREPRRRVRRREPPAAPARVRLLQLGREPARRRATSSRSPAPASATSRASPRATRRSGATSCSPTAKRC